MRRAYGAIDLYDPRRAPCEVDLSDNTNLFGVPPAARRVLAGLGDAAVTRYPSVYGDRLKVGLAALHGVEPSNVVTGCGSDDVIDSAIRAFCDPGDAVAHPHPTFGVVGSFARMNAARPVAVPLDGGVELDAAGLVAAAAPVTYLCSPNNPTGGAAPAAALEMLDRELSGVLLLDEAYADFSGGARVEDSARSERTISLRTMSKAYGLAGLRVGYAVGPAALVREIEKSRGPYKLSALAEAVACEVLAEDGAWVAARVAEAIETRERLRGELERRGLWVAPSSANFLLVRVPDGAGAEPGAASPATPSPGMGTPDSSIAPQGAAAVMAAEAAASGMGDRPGAAAPAETCAAALRRAGVGVRPFPGLPALGDCIRVTVGPWPMMERFLDALDAVLGREAA